MKQTESERKALPILPVLYHYGFEGVVNEYHTGNQSILCPFHDDTSNSGSVNVRRGLFKCFACDAAGDAIALIRYKEGMDYVSAVREAETITGTAHGELRETTSRRNSARSKSSLFVSR